MDAKRQEITEQLHTAMPDKVVDAWDVFCVNTKRECDVVSKGSLRGLADVHGMTSEELADAISHGDYRSKDLYLWVDGKGHINSFTHFFGESNPIDFDELVDYILKNGDECGVLDKDELIYQFIQQYFPYCDVKMEKVRCYINAYHYDIVADDWDDIYGTIGDYIEE